MADPTGSHLPHLASLLRHLATVPAKDRKAIITELKDGLASPAFQDFVDKMPPEAFADGDTHPIKGGRSISALLVSTQTFHSKMLETVKKLAADAGTAAELDKHFKAMSHEAAKIIVDDIDPHTPKDR